MREKKNMYFITFESNSEKEWYYIQKQLLSKGYEWCTSASYISYGTDINISVCIKKSELWEMREIYTTYKSNEDKSNYLLVPFLSVDHFDKCFKETFKIKKFKKLIKHYTESNKLGLL